MLLLLLVVGCWLVAAWRYPDDKDQNCPNELDTSSQEIETHKVVKSPATVSLLTHRHCGNHGSEKGGTSSLGSFVPFPAMSPCAKSLTSVCLQGLTSKVGQ